jgi:hypothetical protein
MAKQLYSLVDASIMVLARKDATTVYEDAGKVRKPLAP